MHYTINMPKEQTPEKEFCKLNVGRSNGHKLAVNKFGLEVKFQTVRRVKPLYNTSIAEVKGGDDKVVNYYFLFLFLIFLR